MIASPNSLQSNESFTASNLIANLNNSFEIHQQGNHKSTKKLQIPPKRVERPPKEYSHVVPKDNYALPTNEVLPLQLRPKPILVRPTE